MSLPRIAQVTAEYMEVLIASAGHGRGPGASSDSQRRGIASARGLHA